MLKRKNIFLENREEAKCLLREQRKLAWPLHKDCTYNSRNDFLLLFYEFFFVMEYTLVYYISCFFVMLHHLVASICNPKTNEELIKYLKNI